MNIMVVSSFFPSHLGGLEIVAQNLVEGLAATGANVVWLASDVTPPPCSTAYTAIAAPSFNLFENRWGIPYPIWSWKAAQLLYKTAKKTDIIHIHDCLYTSSLLAFAVGRILRKPIVFTQHIDVIPYKSWLPRLLMKTATSVFSLMLGAAAKTIFISATTKSYFIKRRTFKKTPDLIPNGVDQILFTPTESDNRSTIRNALGLQNTQPMNLFVGRFVEKKGLLLLREIARKTPEMMWYFVGEGPINPGDWLLPNTVCLGVLSQEEIVPFYRAADLLVLPSVGEGFPLVVQEAMACGTPCLISSQTSLGLLDPPACLLTSALTVETFTESIKTFYHSTTVEQHEELRKDVAAFARKTWNWRTTVRAYLELFQEITGKKSDPILREAA